MRALVAPGKPEVKVVGPSQQLLEHIFGEQPVHTANRGSLGRSVVTWHPLGRELPETAEGRKGPTHIFGESGSNIAICGNLVDFAITYSARGGM